MMSLYNDYKLQYDCWQERPRTISDSFKELKACFQLYALYVPWVYACSDYTFVIQNW